MKERQIRTILALLLVGAGTGAYRALENPTKVSGAEPQIPPVSSPSPSIEEEQESPAFVTTNLVTPTQEPYVELTPTPQPSETRPQIAELADRFILPVEGSIYYGYTFLQEAPRLGGGTYAHAGLDLNLADFNPNAQLGWEDFGAPVLNIANGKCVYAQNSESGFGNVVIIEHRIPLEGGGETMVYSQYSHLNQIDAEEGAVYQIGEPIGTLGNSGGDWVPHLHWEIFGHFHFTYIQEWGFERTTFDRGYVEQTHYDPILFINFRNSLIGN